MDVTQLALDEANRQIRAYRDIRVAAPERFGNAEGCFDNTPATGPFPLILPYQREGAEHYHILWHVYKYDWPLEYIYCVGTASESRGERTDPLLTLDIRDIPAKYIGRFNLNKRKRCDRRSHVAIFARALADGLDLANFARETEERHQREHLVELERRAVEREKMQAEGKARREAARERLRPYIGEGTLVTHERCGGTIEEHYVYDLEGEYGLAGVPTEATIRANGRFWPADDIALANITHVEHVRLDALDWAGKKVDRPLIGDPLTAAELAEREAMDQYEATLPIDLDEEVPF